MNDSTARAATVDDLKTVIEALNRHGVRYLLIGGYALAALGYLRATDLSGVPVRTVSAEGLLKTKQTVRPKDVADRLLLERVVAETGRPE